MNASAAGIIENEDHEIGKRLRNYRDCAVSKLSSLTCNASGDGDSEMDAATIYARVMREFNLGDGLRKQWKPVSIVCFPEPDIDGQYFSEMDYGMLYKHAQTSSTRLIQAVTLITTFVNRSSRNWKRTSRTHSSYWNR